MEGKRDTTERITKTQSDERRKELMPQPLPIEIDVRSVKQMLDGGERFVLLDCREPDEVATARIGGSTHIPMREMSARLGEIQPHHAERIVVHCHHGGRSLRVTQFLRQQGFSQVQNM